MSFQNLSPEEVEFLEQQKKSYSQRDFLNYIYAAVLVVLVISSGWDLRDGRSWGYVITSKEYYMFTVLMLIWGYSQINKNIARKYRTIIDKLTS